MDTILKIIHPENDPRWDAFVQKHPQGSIYHHSAWRQVLLSTYGYTSVYVALENRVTGCLEGILPFMLVRSRITGKRLVSLPFTSYCPMLIPDCKLEEAIQFARGKHPEAAYLELKSLETIESAPDMLEKQSEYTTHILDLRPGQKQVFNSCHATSIRQRVRKAEKSGMKLRMAESEDDLNTLYDLHIDVRKKHGLPPHPYAFFAHMWRVMAPKGFLLVPLLEHEGKVIAGAIVFRYKNTFHFEYSASDQTKLTLSPNQVLIWEVIKIACSEGAEFFDFGRSSLTNQTLIEFKSRWGARRRDLAYYYYPKAKGIDTENGFGRRLLGFTNRLLPDSLLRLEGDFIYPHLG